MAEDGESLEGRVARLEEEVRRLQERFAPSAVVQREDPVLIQEGGAPSGGGTSEELLSWVGEMALLPRISTLCFLLVVALALRTVMDGGLLDKQIGALLGMVYAGALMAIGAWIYRRSSPLAPVFTLSGTLLLCSIVIETHAHFEALSTVPAYLILALAGGVVALISHVYRVALPLFVGILAMSLSALVIDYPNPFFPWLSLVLLAANLLGTFATRLQRCSWLRWILLALTLLMLQVWGLKVGLYLGRVPYGELPAEMTGYLPMLGVFALVYLGSAFLGIVWSGQGRISRFDIALPGITVAWIFMMARYVGLAGLVNDAVLGVGGIGIALLLGGISLWLGARGIEGAPGTGAFTVAAVILVGGALPLVVPGVLHIALLSLVAWGVFRLGERWRSGGVRATAGLLQLYASVSLSLELQRAEFLAPSLLDACAAAAVVFCGIWHYRCARSQPPSEGSRYFSRIDPDDRGAILLLLAALVSGFFAARVGIFHALHALRISEPGAFGCYQSVLVNLSAIILMFVAYLRRSKELRSVAILVMLIGGGKVIFGDLLSARGLPLVVSVFSFGLAAGIESILLGRWKRLGSGASGEEN